MKYLAALLLILPVAARAATLPVINANSQIVQMNMQSDPSGALSPRNIVCDATNPDNCAPVSTAAGLTVLPNQPIAANLQMTATQLTAANLNATVVQSTGTNLHVVVDSCTGCGGGGGGGTSALDASTFTFATTPQTPIGGVYQTTATSNALTSGQTGALQVTANRALFTNLRNASGTEIGTASTPVQVSLANTGANATPIVATATLNQGGTALSATNGIYANLLQSNAVISPGNPIYVSQVPLANNGLAIQSAIVPNNTTSVAVGASANHQLYGIDGYSISTATPIFIKLYNATQGSTTCGSGTPVARYMIPASGSNQGSGQIMHDANGVPFSTALTYCITAGIGDTDTTAPAANTYLVNVYYK